MGEKKTEDQPQTADDEAEAQREFERPIMEAGDLAMKGSSLLFRDRLEENE